MQRNTMRQISWAGLTMLIVMGMSGVTASAQTPNDAELTRRIEQQLQRTAFDYTLKVNPELSIGERAMIDVGMLASIGFLAVDDDDQSTRILRQYDLQTYGYLNIDGVHEFFGRARFTYRDFNSGDSFEGNGDHWVYPLYDRLWYRFDLRRAIEAYEGRYSPNNLRLQVGRQYVQWGSGLMFADELYAAVVDLEVGNLFDFRFLAGTTPSSTVIDFDSSRPSFDGDTERLFVGAEMAVTAFENHRPYISVLSQRDDNDEDFAVLAFQFVPGFPTPIPTRFEYDSIYWAIGSTGNLTPRLSYEIEGIYETGEGLSNSFDPATLNVPPPVGTFVQTEEDIEAWAVRGELTYQLFDHNMTKFELEGVVASGDDDRALDTSNTFGGNTSGTDDNAFNGLGYINTGLAFAPPVSNLTMIRLGASTFPLRDSNLTRRLRIGADVFLFGKTDTDAPIDEATSDDWLLGSEVDVYANWRIASDVVLFMRYGVFFPGEAISADNDERHFFYSGVTYSF